MLRKASYLGVVLLAASLAQAAVGDLTPVACDPDEAIFPPVMAAGEVAAKPAQGAAALGPKALAGKVTAVGTKVSIQVALDYTNPEADEPDVLYLDFTGEGKFDKKGAIRLLTVTADKPLDFQAHTAPTPVKVHRDGKAFLATVRGITARMKQERQVVLLYVCAVQGKCAFGRQAHAVRLIDNTGDFRFDKKGKFDTKDSHGLDMSAGDTVLIDTGDGTFTTSVIKAYYGQPVFVNGAWYIVEVPDGGNTVSARPVEVKFGRLALDNDKWEAVLEDNGNVFCVSGGKRPIAVPAGKYNLLYYRQWSTPNAKGQRAWLLAGITDFMAGKGKVKIVTIREGETTKLDIGLPLKADLAAEAVKRAVTFSLKEVKTRGGVSIALLTRPGGQFFTHPDPPKVNVYDAKGKVIYTASLEYG